MNIGKHPIKDDYLGCWGVATFASNTKSHDDKGRGGPGDCLLRRVSSNFVSADFRKMRTDSFQYVFRTMVGQ